MIKEICSLLYSFYCCGFEHTLIISLCPWLRGPGTSELSPLLSVLWLNSRQWPGYVPLWSSGSPFKFMWVLEELSPLLAAGGGYSLLLEVTPRSWACGLLPLQSQQLLTHRGPL